MKIYTLSEETSKEITSFNSNNSFYSRIIKNQDPSSIGFIQIDPNGNIGRHEAPSDQLFIVISGQGWVTGKDEIKHEILQGDSALWKSGELHESGSMTGMIAIVIESENIEPLMEIKET